MFAVQLNGLPELEKKLEGLAYDVRYKGGRFALRKAAQVVRDAAKQKAAQIDDPQTAADIEKNIVERWANKRFRSTGDLMFRVGVLGGAGGNKTSEQLSGNPGGDTRHWRYLEFGTEKTRAQPFMRPAMEQSAQRATDEFIKQYSAALDRALRKGSK